MFNNEYHKCPFRGGEDSLNNPAYFSIFNSLDDEALGGGGVGCAEGDEVGAGGVLGNWKLEVERCDFGVEEFAACGVGEGH